MTRDIDGALKGWEFKPGVVQARLVETDAGREVIQVRVDLGILQLERTGRPDGSRPHGYPTYFDYLKHLARKAARAEKPLVLEEAQCQEADREFVQFYHRRVAWLALRQYVRAIADADHTLAFMDFVRTHSPGEEYTQAHEQYRGFVLFHRTQAAAHDALEKDTPEAAIDAIAEGLQGLRRFFAAFDLEEQMEEDGMVQQLRKLERTIRDQHHIGATLREQLEEAVAKEQYEEAARLRDALRRRA
jgi:hypothetical protein